VRKRVLLSICAAAGLVLAGCSQAEQKKVDQKTAEAKQEVQKAGQDLKRDLNSAGIKTSTAGAGQKLDHAGNVARRDATEAGRKLDHAALITQVKAKLASDVGLRTVSSVDVDATGHTVTLRGTVSSAEQKQAAEHAVAEVDGVTHVVNELTVQ
jgi:BON domain